MTKVHCPYCDWCGTPHKKGSIGYCETREFSIWKPDRFCKEFSDDLGKEISFSGGVIGINEFKAITDSMSGSIGYGADVILFDEASPPQSDGVELSPESLNDPDFVDMKDKADSVIELDLKALTSELWDWTNRIGLPESTLTRKLLRLQQRIQRFLHKLGFPVAMVCAIPYCNTIWNVEDDGLFIPVYQWEHHEGSTIAMGFNDLIPLCPDCAKYDIADAWIREAEKRGVFKI